MENTTPKLGIIESDPWLEPYSAAIEGRHQHALDKELELIGLCHRIFIFRLASYQKRVGVP